MGVMSFAQERGIVNCHECPVKSCDESQCVEGKEYFVVNRVIECPYHVDHDAEELYVYVEHRCAACGVIKETYVFDRYEYNCLT